MQGMESEKMKCYPARMNVAHGDCVAKPQLVSHLPQAMHCSLHLLSAFLDTRPGQLRYDDCR